MENSSKNLESRAHSKSFIRYHFVFSTKYRKRCFEGHEKELRSVCDWISGRCYFKVLHLGIDRDHIHILVKAAPSMSPEQIVRRLKQLTTREMWKHHEGWLSKFYWGEHKNLWASGYFCSTIGQVSEDRVVEYIENQGK